MDQKNLKIKNRSQNNNTIKIDNFCLHFYFLSIFNKPLYLEYESFQTAEIVEAANCLSHRSKIVQNKPPLTKYATT